MRSPPLGRRFTGQRPGPQEAAPRRFSPPCSGYLTIDQVRGLWRPSGAVGGVGVFAVVWETRSGTFWAALHDFCPADQLRLIEACRFMDRDIAGGA
jgi:hypothetical protein